MRCFRRSPMPSPPSRCRHQAFADAVAAKPLPTEDLRSTWCPPDWEDIVDWYDDIVKTARNLSTNRYR
jgi:hypothetical protein